MATLPNSIEVSLTEASHLPITLNVKKFREWARLPEYGNPEEDDLCFDLHYCPKNDPKQSIFLCYHNSIDAGTGIGIEIPQGYGLRIHSRSGLAVKYGIHVMAGVIDSRYHDEIFVALVNLSQYSYTIKPGERIAQARLVKKIPVEFQEVTDLEETNRSKGLGDSGRF